jgi:hypothetical protein
MHRDGAPPPTAASGGKSWVNVSHILATLPAGLAPLASGTWRAGPVSAITGFMIAEVGPSVNVTCYLSGDTLTRTDLRQANAYYLGASR